MKVLVEKEIGGDGAKAVVGIEAGALVVQISYPLAKLVQPVTDLVNQAVDKAKAAIPGTWDDALLEGIKLEAEAKLTEILSDV